MFKRKSNVVGDKKIKMTVAVVIKKGTSGSPARRACFPESGLLSHIRECAIAHCFGRGDSVRNRCRRCHRSPSLL